GFMPHAPPCRSVSSRHRTRSALPSFPTRRSSDLGEPEVALVVDLVAHHDRGRQAVLEERQHALGLLGEQLGPGVRREPGPGQVRSEEHTSELQSREKLVCRLLLEKKKKKQHTTLR